MVRALLLAGNRAFGFSSNLRHLCATCLSPRADYVRFIAMVNGRFLVGLGAAWAGGCTPGHGAGGIADVQVPALIAVIGFFAGGCARVPA